ncbi:MAG: ABC transporter ATP-binding protein [Janthinobacterium lividum]
MSTTRTDTPTEAGTRAAAVEVDPTERWRGVALDAGPVDATGSKFLRVRSRELLGSLLRPFRGWIIAMVGIVLVENAARLSIPLLVARGIDDGLPPVMAGGSARTLLEVVAAMLVAVVLQSLGRVSFLRVSGRIGQDVLLELRRRVFTHFQRLDVAFHDRYTSGRVTSRLTSDIDAITELLAGGFDGLITALLTMIGVAALMISLDLKLGLVCLICFPAMLLLVRWFARRSAVVYRRVRELSALVIVQFVETMTGIRAVQAYRREPRNSEIFFGVADRYKDANTDSFRLVAVFMPTIRLIGNVTIGVAVLYGGLRALEGDVTIGVLTAFLLYLRMFFEPMQDISQFFNTFQSASSALEKLSGVLEEQPSVVEPTRPVPLPHARGEVRFEGVGFGYVSNRPVVAGLDLTLREGETVAVVGTTGAGKTTIAKLLARFYDPTEGRVTLDGVDLRDLSDVDLRRAVVMVTQENVMFAGSVADNIGFGRPDASRDDVEAAAHAVGAHTFIEALPEGYDTDLARGGGRLSAGQRQLVAFARAFLADPAVLVLDEATSSLDIPSERLVQQALQTVLADRTAVIIAHRLSTVEIADRVLVVEHGEIVEQGSPEQLLREDDGRYLALHEAWEASLA